MTSPEIVREVRNRISFITLNRPDALNALSLDMINELGRQLRSDAADDHVSAVVLRGAGSRAFCAGGDIRALYQSHRSGQSLHRQFFTAEYSLDYLLYGYPKPCIALMDGITMGGGLGLAQGAALRVVGDRTRLAMPEVGIGFFPDVGASHFMSRLPGALGLYLVLTGAQIRGADALYAQLADVYLPPSAIAALEDELATIPWTDDPGADLRRVIQGSAAHGLPAPALSQLRPAIDVHFAQSSVGEILKSLDAETRSPYAEWAAQTAKLMRTRSPTMMSVALRQLQRGRTMPLADCFRMELGMVEHCFDEGEFMEGVRALIIDKDNAPRWHPARFEDVTQDRVDAFFRDRWLGTRHPLADLN